MAAVLIAYGTSEGQTARIAEAIAETVRCQGHETTVCDVKDLAATALRRFDGVVVGASVHLSKHDRRVMRFVREHRGELEVLPSAFFSVSLAAHGDGEEAEGYVKQFEAETGWRAGIVAMFGGALLYTRYGFVKRRMLRRVALEKSGDLGTDTSRDYVYTEWSAVTRFAEEFAAGLAPPPLT